MAESELQNVNEESTLISFFYPAQNQALIQKLAAKKVNAFGESDPSFYLKKRIRLIIIIENAFILFKRVIKIN